MNKEEFQQKVLEIANVIHQNYPPKLKGNTEIVSFANAIRDLLEKDAVENNPPVAWMCHGGEIWNTPESPYKDGRGQPLYAHPQPAPEGWQLVPKEPTRAMLDVGHFAYENKAMDMASPTPTEFPEGGASEACYYAMLAAAPEYKEE